MNILLLVFGFLAIMAVSTASFWQISSTVHLEMTSFSGYLSANRDAENRLQKKLYRKLPTILQTSSSQTEKPAPKRSSVFNSHRLRCPPYQNARFQLAALWKEDSHPFVEGVFERLLQQLYGHTSWFKEAHARGDVDALLSSVIQFGKNVEGPILLHELFSSLPPAQAELLYKMVKGTHTYTIEKEKTGYPPLFDFISFSSSTPKETCRFCFAPLPLLRALFDEKTVHEILALEKEKWEEDHKQHTCTKEELLSLLQHRPTSPTQPAQLDTYFHFSRNSGKQQIITGRDEATGIHTERRL